MFCILHNPSNVKFLKMEHDSKINIRVSVKRMKATKDDLSICIAKKRFKKIFTQK